MHLLRKTLKWFLPVLDLNEKLGNFIDGFDEWRYSNKLVLSLCKKEILNEVKSPLLFDRLTVCAIHPWPWKFEIHTTWLFVVKVFLNPNKNEWTNEKLVVQSKEDEREWCFYWHISFIIHTYKHAFTYTHTWKIQKPHVLYNEIKNHFACNALLFVFFSFFIVTLIINFHFEPFQFNAIKPVFGLIFAFI